MNTYRVYSPGLDQDETGGRDILARSAKDAAEIWANHRDFLTNEYAIVGGQQATVVVRSASGLETFWDVVGWSARTYLATPARQSAQK